MIAHQQLIFSYGELGWIFVIPNNKRMSFSEGRYIEMVKLHQT